MPVTDLNIRKELRLVTFNDDVIYISNVKFNCKKKPDGWISSQLAGFYADCEHLYENEYGTTNNHALYKVYLGLTKPTKRQWRKMKRKLRKGK